MDSMKTTYLLTGANLGDRLATLQEAKRLIGEKIGLVKAASSHYETEAWGVADQPPYINQALEVLTPLEPEQVLAMIWEIETALGREPRKKWGSRLIDIDVLFYEDLILNTDTLTLPHPHLHRRNFVLVPMLQIAPEKMHPLLQKTIEELYEATEDTLDVILLETFATEIQTG